MKPYDSLYSSGIAPKVYVGLFGDNSVAVVDTACNHVLKTIPVPAGPHAPGQPECSSSAMAGRNSS